MDALIAALKDDEKKAWSSYNYWRERWSENKGDFHINLAERDRAASNGVFIQRVVSNLERLTK
jgi:hypothetical protein